MKFYFNLLKRKITLALGLLFISGKDHAQPAPAEAELLTRLDSISSCPSVSRHFAGVYLATTLNAVDFFSRRDERIRELMVRLEARFAGYFFNSYYASQAHASIPPGWEAYYEDPAASPLKCILYGINAHINGDIWQALTTEFSLEEIRELKPAYYAYFHGLTRIYGQVYELAWSESRGIRLLHSLTLGFDKPLGKIMLAKWRRRQMLLAQLYYTDQPLFEKKLRKLGKRKTHLDNLIRKHI